VTMLAPIVVSGAAVMCVHGGTAEPELPFSRVLVSGRPIITQSCTYTIAGCARETPDLPCATARWVAAALRVKAGGVPVVTQDSRAVCATTRTRTIEPQSSIAAQNRDWCLAR
jgi:hypothetical protein